MPDLKKLEDELLAAIAAAKNDAVLETVRVGALGKKGSISELLKTRFPCAKARSSAGASIR